MKLPVKIFAKRFSLTLATATVSLLPLAVALAQSPAETSVHVMRGLGSLTGLTGSCPMMGGMSSFADGRLAFLKSELAITAAQGPAWDGYATALKGHLNHMLETQQLMMKLLDAKTPVERTRSYIDAMENRVASLKKLEPALAALYSALTPDQQKKSDDVLTGMGCTM